MTDVKKNVTFLIFLLLLFFSASSYAGNSPYGPDEYFPTVSEAEQILGSENVFGQRKVEKEIGAVFLGRDARKTVKVPFFVQTLKECGDCILFFYTPRFINDGYSGEADANIKNIVEARKFRNAFAIYKRAVFLDYSFLTRTLSSGWHLLKLKTEGNRREILKPRGGYSLRGNETISPALVYIYAMLLRPDAYVGKYLLTADRMNGRAVVVWRAPRIAIESEGIQPYRIAPEIKPDNVQGRRR